MIGRITKIAKDICAVVKNKNLLLVQHINHHLKTLKEGDELTNNVCVHYLLYVAYNYNLRQSLSDLLKLGIDVNTVLHSFEPDYLLRFGKGGEVIAEHEPFFSPIPAKTLLGLACGHGNFEMIKYLIQSHLANVNAQDDEGNAPLHCTVYSDTVRAIKNNQDQVAKYLLQYGADMFIKNKKGETAYEAANRHAPNCCQRFFGYRDPARHGYDGDKVRPIFQQAMTNQKLSTRVNEEKQSAYRF